MNSCWTMRPAAGWPYMEPFTSKSILFVADIGAEAKCRSMISAGRSVIGTRDLLAVSKNERGYWTNY
jgi:hypothetical protein